ncbi:hypothetical protein [Malikia sp.]|uniref:hypothetical protein n=1 Tax=Malikia sp. TaxID=2070706 RepID=UPI00262F5913|nr:hypothetical protein [Malikia sp.]MDD2728677.1 hypothetical protein [Malikia sp.]
MKEVQARVYLPQVSPEVAELVETGHLKPCIFDLADGLYTKEVADKAKTLQRFELVAWPQEIPPGLLALPSDSEVIFRQGQVDRVATVWLVLDCFKSKMERQDKGFFELSEAAEILSESCAGSNGRAIPPEGFSKDMREAFFSGELQFFNERLTKINPQDEDEDCIFGGYGETTTAKAINAWLESMGSPHRFPEPVETPAPPVAAVAVSQASPEPVQAAPAKRVLASQLQDAAILSAIREAGYDPQALPKNPPGKPGIKAAIRNALVGRAGTPFPELGRQFVKSWDRLRDRGEIANA